MSEAAHSPRGRVTRRTALKAVATAVGTAGLLPWLSERGLLAFERIQDTNAPSKPTALTASQFATVEALAEAIIPADERSGGAKQARVADYIDLLLSESESQFTLQWLGGIAALDAEAMARFGAPFARVTATQMDAILADISRNERDPKTVLETFFVMAKDATARGYYTSKIGIHDELKYKGNVFLRQFVGCETQDGKDCSICGQKHL